MRDIDYHLHRARTEREIAYRSGNACVSDTHLRLSALHLARALLLQEVQRAPVGNVIPMRFHRDKPSGAAAADTAGRLIELPACR